MQNHGMKEKQKVQIKLLILEETKMVIYIYNIYMYIYNTYIYMYVL